MDNRSEGKTPPCIISCKSMDTPQSMGCVRGHGFLHLALPGVFHAPLEDTGLWFKVTMSFRFCFWSFIWHLPTEKHNFDSFSLFLKLRHRMRQIMWRFCRSRHWVASARACFDLGVERCSHVICTQLAWCLLALNLFLNCCRLSANVFDFRIIQNCRTKHPHSSYNSRIRIGSTAWNYDRLKDMLYVGR